MTENSRELIVMTPTSSIYKEGERIHKILSKLGRKDEKMGGKYLKSIESDYLATIYQCDSKSQVIEYLPGPNLYSFCEQGDYLSADKIFIQIVNDLHEKAKNLDKSKYSHVREQFSIFKDVRAPRKLSAEIKLARSLAEKFSHDPLDEIVLHGDLHHENVHRSSLGHYKAFDPKGVVGERAYEFASILKNPWNYPSISEDKSLFLERSEYFSKKANLDVDRLRALAFLHFCMSLLWAIQDGAEYTHQRELILMSFDSIRP